MNLKQILKISTATTAIGLSFLGGFYLGIAYNYSKITEPLNTSWVYDWQWKVAEQYTGKHKKQPRYYLVKTKDFPCSPFSHSPLGRCVGFYIPGFIFLSESGAANEDDRFHEIFHALGILNEEKVDSATARIKRDPRFARARLN